MPVRMVARRMPASVTGWASASHGTQIEARKSSPGAIRSGPSGMESSSVVGVAASWHYRHGEAEAEDGSMADDDRRWVGEAGRDEGERKSGITPKQVVAGIIGLALLVFVLQNTDSTS